MKQVYLVTAKGASEGSFTSCDLTEGDACIVKKDCLGWGIYKFPFENMSASLWEGDIEKGYLVEWESAKEEDFNEGVNYYHNALKAVAYLKEASESEMCAIRGPLDIQHGGNHYKDKAIQPIEYILANNMDFCSGNVVKYVTRHKDKGGMEDLMKAKHYLEFLIDKWENEHGN